MHFPMLLRAVLSTLMIGWLVHNSAVVRARVISVLDALDTAGDNGRLIHQPAGGQAVVQNSDPLIDIAKLELNRRDVGSKSSSPSADQSSTSSGLTYQKSSSSTSQSQHNVSPSTSRQHHNVSANEAPMIASVGIEIISLSASESGQKDDDEHTNFYDAPVSASIHSEHSFRGVAPSQLPHSSHTKRHDTSQMGRWPLATFPSWNRPSATIPSFAWPSATHHSWTLPSVTHHSWTQPSVTIPKFTWPSDSWQTKTMISTTWKPETVTEVTYMPKESPQTFSKPTLTETLTQTLLQTPSSMHTPETMEEKTHFATTTMTITTVEQPTKFSSPCGLFQSLVDKCIGLAHVQYQACPTSPALLHKCRCLAYSKKVKCLETSNCRNHPQYKWFETEAAMECGLASQWPPILPELPKVHSDSKRQFIAAEVYTTVEPTITTLMVNGPSALIKETTATVAVAEDVHPTDASFTAYWGTMPEEKAKSNGSSSKRDYLAATIVAAIANMLVVLAMLGS